MIIIPIIPITLVIGILIIIPILTWITIVKLLSNTPHFISLIHSFIIRITLIVLMIIFIFINSTIWHSLISLIHIHWCIITVWPFIILIDLIIIIIIIDMIIIFRFSIPHTLVVGIVVTVVIKLCIIPTIICTVVIHPNTLQFAAYFSDGVYFNVRLLEYFRDDIVVTLQEFIPTLRDEWVVYFGKSVEFFKQHLHIDGINVYKYFPVDLIASLDV